MDIIDNTVTIEDVTAEGEEGKTKILLENYTATVVELRSGPAMESGMLKDGVVIAIEGRNMKNKSFIEVIHCLKEVSLLRPFSVTMAYKKKEKKNEEKEMEDKIEKVATSSTMIVEKMLSELINEIEMI